MLVLVPQKDSCLFPVIILDIYMLTDKIILQKRYPHLDNPLCKASVAVRCPYSFFGIIWLCKILPKQKIH